MQFEPKVTLFDPTRLSLEHPINPEGSLFTYYPDSLPSSLHFHEFFEIGYCEEGSGIFYVSGKAIPFSGKVTSIVYGGQPHIAQSINESKSKWHFLYIDLNYLFSSGNPIGLSKLKSLLYNNYQSYDFPSILPYSTHPEFYNICEQILHEASIFDSSSLPAIQALTYSLLLMHQRTFIKIENVEQKSNQKLDIAIELGPTLNYINMHFKTSIKIEDLIKISNMSKSNLQRKMISLTGRSPINYIHYLRMQTAIALLSDGRKSISEIAIELGYNISSFNRQFLKDFKTSPREYRKSQLSSK